MTVVASYAPKTWQESLLVYGGRIVGAYLLVHFLERLMPGSTTLRMTPEEERRARNLPPEANRFVIIVGTIFMGMIFGVVFLPFANEIRALMVMGPPVVFVFWCFWYTWKKKDKFLPSYYEQEKRGTIRPRRNKTARRRKEP